MCELCSHREARPERLVSDERSEERDLATRGRIPVPERTRKQPKECF